jgi:hypothetical protein
MRLLRRLLATVRPASIGRKSPPRRLRAKPAFEALEDRCTPANFANANEAFIGQVYQHLLSRPVDSAGLAMWGGFLTSNGDHRLAAYAVETAAPQYEFWIHQAELNYMTLLHRPADPAAVNAFVSTAAAGGTIEQLQALILGSQEYFQSQGGGTNQGYLTALYRDLLGRSVDASGQALYGGALSAGVGRQQVAGTLLASREYQENLVRFYYPQYLQRAPQPEEVNGFVNALAGGARLEQVLAVILGSPNGVALIPLTITSVSSSAPNASTGQSVTFTATVAAVSKAVGTPTGTVTFRDGTTTLGTANLNANGTAVFTTSTLTRGAHTITASYGGGGVLAASSATVAQSVKTSTTTTVAGNPNPSASGQTVTITATVASAASGGGTPAGSVTFVDQTTNTNLGSGTLNASGQASITVSNLSVAAHTIKATYAGNDIFATSSGTTTQTVKKATTTAVAGNPNPSTFGQQVTLTATVQAVASGSGTPTGSVTFVDQTTNTNLGSGTLNASGQASITVSTLTAVAHTIVATYAGDPNFATSNGSAPQTVNAAATSTALAGTPNPSTFGQSVTLTATVTSGGGTPVGSVTFVDQTTGATLGQANLNASGVASITTSALAGGSHTIAANYAGGGNFTSSSGTTTQTVNAAATSTALAATPNPSTSGQNVTFTVTVTSGGGTPVGSVTFVDELTGATLATMNLDGTGKATVITAALSVGTHHVKATYAGNTNFATSNGSTDQVVS